MAYWFDPLPLSARARSALIRDDGTPYAVDSFENAKTRTRAEWLRTPGVGEKTAAEIMAVVDQHRDSSFMDDFGDLWVE